MTATETAPSSSAPDTSAATQAAPAQANAQPQSQQQATQQAAQQAPAKESFAQKLDAARKAASEPAKAQQAGPLQLKVPEGADGFVVETVTSIATDLGLPADKAQAVFDRVHEAAVKRAESRDAELSETFSEQLYKDEQWGGEKFDDTVAKAERALKRFWPESHAKLLDGPLGSHPAIRIAFAAIEEAVGPDRLFVGSPAGQQSQEPDLARIMFPHSAALSQ